MSSLLCAKVYTSLLCENSVRYPYVRRSESLADDLYRPTDTTRSQVLRGRPIGLRRLLTLLDEHDWSAARSCSRVMRYLSTAASAPADAGGAIQRWGKVVELGLPYGPPAGDAK